MMESITKDEHIKLLTTIMEMSGEIRDLRKKNKDLENSLRRETQFKNECCQKLTVLRKRLDGE